MLYINPIYMYFLQLFKYIICFKKETMVYKAIFQLFPLPINKGNNCAQLVSPLTATHICGWVRLTASPGSISRQFVSKLLNWQNN